MSLNRISGCIHDIMNLVIQKITLTLSLLALMSLNTFNTVKGIATGVGRDMKAVIVCL